MLIDLLLRRDKGSALLNNEVDDNFENLGEGVDLASSDWFSPTEPATTIPYMTWADTGNMLLKRRNAANTAWETVGWLTHTAACMQRFTASGTFTVPAETVWVTMVGGGGGGGDAADATNVGGGGGGGGGSGRYVYRRKVTGLTVGSTVNVTVGSGGTAVPPVPGGSSSFGSHVTVLGGGVGVSASMVFGGAGGQPSGTCGATGGEGANYASGSGGTGGSNPFGQGGSGGARSGSGGVQGGGGLNGTGYGAGGGGGGGGRLTGFFARGGLGTSGIVIVEWGLTED